MRVTAERDGPDLDGIVEVGAGGAEIAATEAVIWFRCNHCLRDFGQSPGDVTLARQRHKEVHGKKGLLCSDCYEQRDTIIGGAPLKK